MSPVAGLPSVCADIPSFTPRRLLHRPVRSTLIGRFPLGTPTSFAPVVAALPSPAFCRFTLLQLIVARGVLLGRFAAEALLPLPPLLLKRALARGCPRLMTLVPAACAASCWRTAEERRDRREGLSREARKVLACERRVGVGGGRRGVEFERACCERRLCDMVPLLWMAMA